MSDYSAEIKKILTENGLSYILSDGVCEKLSELTNELIKVNSYMNLTAIKEPAEIALKHYADCLLASQFIPSGASVADIGCGGGFPSLPLAIARPDIKITAIDSTAKKTGFVDRTAKYLKLDNLQTVTGRAEELGADKPYRESFDVAIARAVAALPILSELCLPMVRRGGSFIAMKSVLAEQELQNSANAFAVLGGKAAGNETRSLVSGNERYKRTFIIIQKQAHTPKIYPRNYAQINKKPL